MKRTMWFLSVVVICIGAGWGGVACAAEDAGPPKLGMDLPSAERQLRLGDCNSARTILGNLIAGDPDSPELQVAMVDVLLATGQYDEALKIATGAAEKFPEDPLVLCSMASAMGAKGDYDGQRSSLETALKIDEDCREARVQLGALHKAFGRDEKATELLEVFEDLLWDEKFSTATEWYIGGLAMWHLDYPHEALECFTKAQRADDSFADAFVAAGDLFYSKQQIGDAWQEYRDALKINPASPGALLGCARCQFHNGEFAQAEQSCRAALETNPSLVAAHDLLAAVDLVDERYDQAREKLDAALKINPNSLDSRSLLASLHFLENDTEKFEEECRRVLAVDPKCSDLYETVGQACTLKRRMDDAGAMFQKALEIDPESSDALAELGLLYLREAQYEEGRQLLEKSFRINNFNARVYNSLELCDKMDTFQTHKTDNFVFKVDAENDPVLAHYATIELEKIREEVCSRFKSYPAQPIYVEVFPTHRWLGARVAGMPHIGPVGVCLGKVIAVDSPKVIGKDINWRDLLTHEFTHVVNLLHTRNRVYHWFTEGCAVSQEAVPQQHEWNRMLLRYVKLDRLIPIVDLTRGFVRPSDLLERQMAYSESGMVVNYLRQKHGEESVLKILDLCRDGALAREAIEEVTGQTLEDFQAECFTYIRGIAAKLPVRPLFLPPDVEALEARAQNNPNDAAVLCDLAQGYLVVGEFEQAREQAGKALATDPKISWGHVVLADVAMQQEKKDEAAALLEKAVAIDPSNASAWFMLGMLRKDAGDVAAAAKAFETGVAAYPVDPGAYEELAGFYAELEKPKERREVLESWIKADPHDSKPARELLGIYFDEQQWDDVLRIAQHLIYIVPSDPEVHAKLGRALVKLDKAEEAVQELVFAFQLGTTDGEACAILAKHYFKLGKKEEAIPPAERAVENGADVDEMKTLLRDIYRGL